MRFLQQRVGRVTKPEHLRLLLALERLDRELVDLPDDRRMLEAVGEDVLPVEDGLGLGQAGEEAVPRDVAQVLIPTRHRVEERVELEVLRERLRVCRKIRLEVEVTLAVREVRLHRAMRLLSRSDLRPYFSAIAQA